MSIQAGGKFDAVIVGAGPAGAYLGELLAKGGLSVAILEKRRFPRDKVCGGGLSRKAIDLLGFDLSAVVRSSVREAVVTFGNRDGIVKEAVPAASFTVVRREFDALLLARAQAAGARLFSETAFEAAAEVADSLEVKTSQGPLRCRWLFGADGAASRVRSRMFGRALVRSVPALEAIVRVAPRQLARIGDRAIFDFGALPGGYGWIFPKGDHLNVGVYSPFPRREAGPLRAHLDQFMRRYEALAQPRDIQYQGWPIPIANGRSEFQRGRVWLLGDAAGLAEPLFGEGIYFALKSAALAAQAVDEESQGASSGRYTALVRRELGPELCASRRMARLIYRFPRFAFRHLARNPSVSDDFALLLGGALSYRRCLSRTLLRFPRWLAPGRPPESACALPL